VPGSVKRKDQCSQDADDYRDPCAPHDKSPTFRGGYNIAIGAAPPESDFGALVILLSYN